MKRLLSIIFFVGITIFPTWSQDVSFKFTDGIHNERLKISVEKNISQLLTSINKAAGQQSPTVNLAGIKITEPARHSFNELWECMPFSCDDNTNLERCIQPVTSYQVRGIPVTLHAPQEKQKDPEQELTICFNSEGEITDIFFALEQHIVNTILHPGADVNDARRREEIINFVEHYRDCIQRKDLQMLGDILSEDLIFIEGNQLRKAPSEGNYDILNNKELSKGSLLESLSQLFKRKQDVKVTFNNIEVARHPTRCDLYLLSFHQNIQTTRYEFGGYMSFLWMFPENGGTPCILVRTWQSDESLKSKDDILDIEDFNMR